eukprot:gene2497-4854_t
MSLSLKPTVRNILSAVSFPYHRYHHLAKGILDGDRKCLSKAITLSESSRDEHKVTLEHLLQFLISNNRSTNSEKTILRVGITGPPGAGKSTFIEKFGLKLISIGKKVAVLPVDPSSHISGGSILGDQTRMPALSSSPHAYVRASPTRGILGGITHATPNIIQLCEYAGYDFIIVESVGLGQSEVELDYAVDMLILIVPPVGGDDLQAVKKGIMEAADLILVNKADGNLINSAKNSRTDYENSIQFIRKKYPEWSTPVLLISSKENQGIDAVLEAIQTFQRKLLANNRIELKRSSQVVHWMWMTFKRELIQRAMNHPIVVNESRNIIQLLSQGKITYNHAASRLVDIFLGKNS